MTEAPHHCVLCGSSCGDLSQHPSPSIVELVQHRYARGPLVYPVIMGWEEPQMPVCRLCFRVHQLRRTVKQKERRLLPMDATVLQTIVPGQARQQDSRTRERMCAALRKPGNSYSKSFEVVRVLLSNRPPTLRLWWDLNLQTEFFVHKGTARVMRKLKG